jgi:hypothetical protein
MEYNKIIDLSNSFRQKGVKLAFIKGGKLWGGCGRVWEGVMWNQFTAERTEY